MIKIFGRYKKIKNFLFDLDGTVWNWTSLMPDVRKVIKKLEDNDKKVFYISNNSILSREGLSKKLNTLGIRTTSEQIINSAYVAAKYFEENGINEVYVIGEKGLVDELSKHGISISDKGKAVIISTDRNFTYWKLKTAHDLAKKGADLYCSGHGKYWLVGDKLYPGEESIVKAVEEITGKTAILLGKPSDIMKKRVLGDLLLFPENTLFIGDSLNSDIAFGAKCGFRTGLVLTGNTKMQDLRGVKGLEKPSVVITDINELLA